MRTHLFGVLTALTTFALSILPIVSWAFYNTPIQESTMVQSLNPVSKLDWNKLADVRPPLHPLVAGLSERERDGLFGPVKQVRENTEFTSPTNPQWNPRWVRISQSDSTRTISYDSSGRKVSDVKRPGCGLVDPEKRIYNDRGQLSELISYNLRGGIERRALFSYNDQGWLVETTSYDGNNVFQAKWTYQYKVDSRGNWIGQIPTCEGCSLGMYNSLAVYCRSISYYR